MTQQSFIDWAAAPEWANYAAQDADGEWYWYEKEPFRTGNLWGYQDNTRYCPVVPRNKNWQTTLQKRPRS
jgi:hypothetical protein